MPAAKVAGIEFDHFDVLAGDDNERDIMRTGPGLALDVYVQGTANGYGALSGGIIRVYARAGVTNAQWTPVGVCDFRGGDKGLALAIRGGATEFRITMQGGELIEGPAQNRTRISYALSHCGTPPVLLGDLNERFSPRSERITGESMGDSVVLETPALVRIVGVTLTADGEGWIQLRDSLKLLDTRKLFVAGDGVDFDYVHADGRGTEGNFVEQLRLVYSALPTVIDPIAVPFFFNVEYRPSAVAV